MSVLQYVGARYVPKIYTNPSNPSSAEWTPDTAYEALTIVTYNNASYISRVPVPATIGNPAQNPTYWLLSGSYNAYISQIQQEIEDLRESVTEDAPYTTKRHYVMIGDSYFAGHAYSPGWRSVLPQIMSLETTEYDAATDADLLIDGKVSAPAFWASTATHKSFIDQLKSLVSHMAAENITITTDVIVGGGYNEIGGNSIPATVEGIKAFSDYCYATFPNLKRLYVVFMGATNIASNRNLLIPFITAYNYAPEFRGISLNVADVLYKRSLIGADKVHPTDIGTLAIAEAMANAIQGTPRYRYDGQTIGAAYNMNFVENHDDVSIPSSRSLFSVYMGGSQKILIPYMLPVVFTTPKALPADSPTTIVSGTVSSEMLMNYGVLIGGLSGYASNSEESVPITGQYTITNGEDGAILSISVNCSKAFTANSMNISMQSMTVPYPFM